MPICSMLIIKVIDQIFHGLSALRILKLARLMRLDWRRLQRIIMQIILFIVSYI